MLKILLIDDHQIVRQGLKQILKETSDIKVAGEAGSAEEIDYDSLAQRYNVILLDISMPGKNGLEILADIKVRYPELPVLVLSMHPEEQYATRALKGGAAGYLTKSSAPDELIKALRSVAEGKRYITESLAERLALNLDKKSDESPEAVLSNRELEVLNHIASGKTIKEISEKLYLSVKTVSTYRARILQKLRLKTNSELIKYAVRKQLI